MPRVSNTSSGNFAGTPLPGRLVITNALTELPRMNRWLREIAQQFGAPPEIIYRYDLCADEAVTNIIGYGFPKNEAHEIELRFSRNHNSLVLEIADDGAAFNPWEHPEPVLPASLEDANIGGLGIHLIRKFMDECTYERSNGRNLIRLTCHIGGARGKSRALPGSIQQ